MNFPLPLDGSSLISEFEVSIDVEEKIPGILSSFYRFQLATSFFSCAGNACLPTYLPACPPACFSNLY